MRRERRGRTRSRGCSVPSGRMHADEVDTDATLVRRLLIAQFPQWADLPIEPVPSAGTDNAIYRLGDWRSNWMSSARACAMRWWVT